MSDNLFDAIERTPAVQSLLRRLEKGGLLPLPGACLAAQPFLAAALHRWLPQRPLVVVTDCLKTQESFQQDLETWLQLKCEVRSAKCEVRCCQSVLVRISAFGLLSDFGFRISDFPPA